MSTCMAAAVHGHDCLLYVCMAAAVSNIMSSSDKDGGLTAAAEQLASDMVQQLNLTDLVVDRADEVKPEDVHLQPTTSSQASLQQQQHPAENIHHVKWIGWQHHTAKVPIVTQNENGPCPLLAIINVLLLRGQVQLEDNADFVTGQRLMERLGDCMLRLAPKDISAELQANYEQNVSDAIATLPKLMTGLDVNVRFTGVRAFEYTDECVVFDLLNIPLYHGWCVDDNDTQLAQLIGTQTYNQLIERYIDDKANTGDDAAAARAAVVGHFLDESASQLTSHGLAQLKDTLRDGELAVFFRNNHFSTILKEHNELYLLVTDDGFLHESSIIWEMLCSVSGDNHFVDSAFQRFVEHKPATAAAEAAIEPAPPVNKQSQEDQDYMFALSLAQEQADSQSLGGAASPLLTPEQQLRADAELAKRLQEAERVEQQQADQQQQRAQQQQQPKPTVNAAERRVSQPPTGQQQQQRQLAVAAPHNRSDSFQDIPLHSQSADAADQSICSQNQSSLTDQQQPIELRKDKEQHGGRVCCFQCQLL